MWRTGCRRSGHADRGRHQEGRLGELAEVALDRQREHQQVLAASIRRLDAEVHVRRPARSAELTGQRVVRRRYHLARGRVDQVDIVELDKKAEVDIPLLNHIGEETDSQWNDGRLNS